VPGTGNTQFVESVPRAWLRPAEFGHQKLRP
jgi:hypothetical protein